MTTAVRRPESDPAAWSIMAVVSSRVRKPNTPGVRVRSSTHMPSTGGKYVRLPVARTSVSYDSTVPSLP